jgi:hypothetical protein
MFRIKGCKVKGKNNLTGCTGYTGLKALRIKGRSN